MARGAAIHAVIVTYRPNWQRLRKALSSLAPQVKQVVIVDNGGHQQKLSAMVAQVCPGARVLPQASNIGVASAQNLGIRTAQDLGAEYVLLLDDDSVPAPEMVSCLHAALVAARDAGEKIAAVGPVCADERQPDNAYFVAIGLPRLKRLRCAPHGNGVVRCDLLIASGMLLPMSVLAQVGYMDESLFIDYVDTEWCLRALSRGFGFLGICGARLSHRIGDGAVRVGRRRRLLTHRAERYYYIFRNSVALYRRSYPSLRWKLADAARLAALLVGLALFVKPRIPCVKSALSGLLDGMRLQPSVTRSW